MQSVFFSLMDNADRLRAEGIALFQDIKFNPSQPVPKVQKCKLLN